MRWRCRSDVVSNEAPADHQANGIAALTSTVEFSTCIDDPTIYGPLLEPTLPVEAFAGARSHLESEVSVEVPAFGLLTALLLVLALLANTKPREDLV